MGFVDPHGWLSLPEIMKMSKIYFGFLSVLLYVLSASVSMEPRNPETQVTGAPGETTCEKSGCHSGGKFIGTVTISGIPDTVVPNTKYTITLTHKSNAKVTGFELTCIDPLNKKCGTLTAGTGSNVATGATTGRQYVRQSNSKSLVDSTASWDFSWTSPATITGDTVSFYFTSLAGSGANGEKGDNALKNVRKVFFNKLTATREIELEGLELLSSLVTSELAFRSEQNMRVGVSVFNESGLLVAYEYLNTNQRMQIGQLPTGVYHVLIEKDNARVVRRLMKI